MNSRSLVEKYDVPGPRYTSYPTVALWGRTPTEAEWLAAVERGLVADAAAGKQGAALYVHIPFCGSLCTFCGCNTRITRSQSVVAPYVQSVLDEFALYRNALGRPSLLVGEVNLGGGTPTFLEAGALAMLLGGLFEHVTLAPGAALSVEIDPRVTSREQLAVLARHGFTRLSLGVQDFDPRVQEVVNRVQTEAQVQESTTQARELGFDSISYDLIYGLPLQTAASIDLTLDALGRLRPERVALYGYTHVPWIKPGQRRFTEADLPEGDARRALYVQSRERLAGLGYREIALDHFALPSDAHWQATQAGTLHRNFMGFTTHATQPLLGLGVSAIGEAGDAYAQNEKELQPWQERVARGELPLHRGHMLDAEDRVLRQHILNIMTRFRTGWSSPAMQCDYLAEVPGRLVEMARDGLLELRADGLAVTEAGRPYLRNVCMAFDARLTRRSPNRELFSRTA